MLERLIIYRCIYWTSLLEFSLPLGFHLATLPPGPHGLISGISGVHQRVAEEKEEHGEDGVILLLSEYCVNLLVGVSLPSIE